MSVHVPLDFADALPLVFGVDPAWMGTDRSVAVMRQGMAAKVLFYTRGADTCRLSDLVTRRANELKPHTIFVDQTGVGAGVFDQLKNTNHRVVGIAFAERPTDQNRFLNKRAEMWWLMREWLEKGPVIERHDDLRNDLIAPEYYFSDNGKIQLESKDSMRERGVPSPDLGDALALTFAMQVYPDRHNRQDEGQTAPYDAYGWMERN